MITRSRAHAETLRSLTKNLTQTDKQMPGRRRVSPSVAEGQTMNCKDGGTCHHNCQTECFRKDCCVPLSTANLLDNWNQKTRLVRRYRGWVIKVFNRGSSIPTWDAEYQLVRNGFVMKDETSSRTLSAAMGRAKRDVDSILAHEAEVAKARDPKRWWCTKR